MTSRKAEHERYLRQILSQTISSGHPSEETLRKARKESSSYFNKLKIGL